MKTPKTAEKLNAAIEEYFSGRRKQKLDRGGEPLCDASGEPIYEELPCTVTGLAYFLGLCSRDELFSFKDPKMKRLIERALLRIESFGEEKLFSKDSFSGTKLFLEKNFSRWSDIDKEDEGFDEEDLDILRKWAR